MRAHILIMRSYNNAYINMAGLAGLLTSIIAINVKSKLRTAK